MASRGDQVNKAFICSDQTTRSVLSEMRDLMAAQGLDDEALGTLELILAEALNNVTEHAYGPEGGPVELSIRLSGPGQGARTASAQPTNHTPAKPQAGAATDPLANAATASDISLGGDNLGADDRGRNECHGSATATAPDAAAPVILCELRDFGRPMPAGGPPGPGLPPIAPPDILPEGGFGWHIIRCLVLDLTYERTDNCNRLRLTVQASPAK